MLRISSSQRISQRYWRKGKVVSKFRHIHKNWDLLKQMRFEVEAVVNCEGLLPEKLRRPSTDVLNGIACHDGRIFLTGKYWPRLYEVKLVSRKK